MWRPQTNMSGRFAAARHNLTLLQDILKRDPGSYKPEFIEQYRHYEQNMKLFRLQPQNADTDHIQELVGFISHTGHFYPEESKNFSAEIIEVLRTQGPNLNAAFRLSLCKALVLLRNKKQLAALEFVSLIFDYLLQVRDKNLRKFLFATVITHLKSISLIPGKRDGRLSSQIQNLVFSKLKDSHSIVVRTSLLIMIECYRKNIWRDTKTANAIASLCFTKSAKIRVTALKFLLGSRKAKKDGDDSDDSEDSDSDEEQAHENVKSRKELMVGFKAGKKTQKRKRAMERANKAIEKEQKKAGKKKSVLRAAEVTSMACINDLYDPHEFCEKLFRQLEKSTDRFEVKLLYMAMISKVVGIHKLMLLGFYSYLHRYIKPHQREVTKILLFAAQASHDLVPPDITETLVRHLVDNFVTDRNSPEVMTVGLNAAREILSNSPLAVNEDLLRDLTLYKKYRNKNVSMAARSLIQLFREINPKLLHRKDRGQPTEAIKELNPSGLAYGKKYAPAGIPGAECLSMDQENADEEPGDDDDEWEDEDSDEGDWIDVKHSDDEIEIDSGSEDEQDENDDGENEDEKEDEEGEEELSREEKMETVSASRILTQEEFRKIQVHQLKKRITPSGKNKNKEKTEGEMNLEELEKQSRKRGHLPTLNDIEHLHKRPKMNKAERVARIHSGREGREEFGGKFKRRKENAKDKFHLGRTNRNTGKNKNFQMLRVKKGHKNRQRSYQDRQKSLKDYLTKQKKMH